jgi:hypothetical protein
MWRGGFRFEHICSRLFRLAVPSTMAPFPHPPGPEAVARPRFPQIVACGFPAPRSSAVGSQLSVQVSFPWSTDLLSEPKAATPVAWSPCRPRTITADRFPMWPALPSSEVLSVTMASTRSSDPSHLFGLAGPTSLCLNRMDLPCSRCFLWLHAGGTNPGSISGRSL